VTLDEVRALDRADPLAPFRARFRLPPGVIYLDGNSLGPLPVATASRLREVVEGEWGAGLIRSWNDARWMDAPRRVGALLAPLLGADPDEVVVADSTSIDLFKLVVAAARLNPAGRSIVAEAGNFPTDLHLARSAAELVGAPLRVVPREGLLEAITPEASVVVLSHVHYRGGERFDLQAVTAHAARCGAKVVWDLSHSAGAVALDLHAAGVELAVGCGYKYLNGGPGAPAFLYVARALQPLLTSPLPGWLGHARPFDFEDAYQPAEGVERFRCGTPPVLSLLALESGVALLLEAPRPALFEKAERLFTLFADLARERCPALTLLTPREPARRGSHLAFAHPQAHGVVRALEARGVLGDFRSPDVARFGLAPLYTRYEDVWNAAAALALVLDSGEYADPRFAARARVT
jgi:kynureninase